MRNFLCICIVLLVLAGCKNKFPDDIMRPVKIEPVMYDMHIVDSYISTIPLQDSAKKTAAAFYKSIYKKYGIDSALYTKSMNFYYDNPEMLNLMYDRVKGRLKKSKDSLDKIETKRLAKVALAEKKLKDAAAKVKKDSLAKVELKIMAKLTPAQRLKRQNIKKKDSLNKAAQLKVKTPPTVTKSKLE